jgi:tRNA splicing endonuclease
MASSPPRYSHSALIYSGSLLHKLENHPSLRLPTTYVGVRRVRPSKSVAKTSDDAHRDENKRKRCDGVKDEFLPSENNKKGSLSECNDEADVIVAATNNKANEISYKVINADGSEKRMSKQEKRELKYKLLRAKRDAEKEKRRIEHEQRIKDEKEAKRERKKLKRLERRNKKLKLEEVEEREELDGQAQQAEKTCHDATKNDSQLNLAASDIDSEEYVPARNNEINEELAALKGERSGIPPAILSPAATCVAIHMNALHQKKQQHHVIKTVFDRDLTIEWANQLKKSMVSAEELRSKEDMRPMPYRIVPELWNRFCPDSLFKSEEDGITLNQAVVASQPAEDELATLQDNQYSLGLIRNPSPLNDEAAYRVFRHLNQYSNLHISSGEIFGCDFLLYDGKREDRHSFAGLRVYTCNKKKNESVAYPIPSAYDMSGFVRSMNTARKLALIATVAKDEEEGGTNRVLIVDLALEKVLDAPTHIKKGVTEKRKSVRDTSIGLSKHKG